MIDINCDMGEGIKTDPLIMPFINSANIACGYHAGDEFTIRQTISLALQHHVFIGAHPSFNDKINFGRTEMQLPLPAIFDLVLMQVKIIDGIAKEMGAVLHHVKPHGALYNMSAKDAGIAATIATAVKSYNADLVLFGLSGSVSISEAKEIGLKTASEVFADRTYQDDGSLTSRKDPNAMINSVESCLAQVKMMRKQGLVRTVSGKQIPIIAETICVHGDGAHALEFLKAISNTLK